MGSSENEQEGKLVLSRRDWIIFLVVILAGCTYLTWATLAQAADNAEVVVCTQPSGIPEVDSVWIDRGLTEAVTKLNSLAQPGEPNWSVLESGKEDARCDITVKVFSTSQELNEACDQRVYACAQVHTNTLFVGGEVEEHNTDGHSLLDEEKCRYVTGVFFHELGHIFGLSHDWSNPVMTSGCLPGAEIFSGEIDSVLRAIFFANRINP